MGLNRSAPWWLTWLLVAGLMAIFLGERVLDSVGAARAVLSLGGSLIVLGCLVWRTAAWHAATGEARSVERLLLLTYTGCAAALLLYLVGSEIGMRWLGLEFGDPTARARFVTILQVLWPILLAASMLPAVAAQLALAAHRGASTEASGVESFRVRETAAAGLTIGLAGALLFVIGYIATQRDRSLDLSYFRTSTPGSATEGMVRSLDDELRILLFFPAVNPVKDEAARYFRRLRESVGGVRVEEFDRFVNPREAEQFSVAEDGTVVLAYGGMSERITLGASLDLSRRELRRLDQRVQQALLMLIREERVAYLTTGHGELNDPATARVYAGAPLGRLEALRDMLEFLNYEVRDIGLASGLGFDVPEDAAMLLIVGPQRPFHESVMASVVRFLDRGGAVLLALDPGTDFDMGPLESRLGVRFVPVPLVDDQQHLRQRGDLSDRRLLVTDRFSTHPVMETVNRAGPEAGLLVLAPGYLEGVEEATASPAFVLRSAPTTFGDLDQNYHFSEATETRRSYEIMAAIEASPPAEGDPTEPDSQTRRALVFASAGMLSDAVVTSLGFNAAVVSDAIRWLGGEEAFIGSTVSEEDIPIVHTRAENVAWFYAIIFGAPGLVLAVGLMGVYRYRRARGGQE